MTAGGTCGANGWPEARVAEADLAARGRGRFVVGGARVALALLVVVAVAATIVTRPERLSVLRLAGLVVTGCAYAAWALYGTREAARFLLRGHGAGAARAAGPAGTWPPPRPLGAAAHVAMQFALAEAIVWLASPAGVVGLLWLVLLPPVGFAVMFMRPAGVALAAAAALAAHALNVAWWHGWGPVAVAMPGFSVALLYTLVFTHVAVSAERARGEAERLAAELAGANEQLRRQALQAEELAATRERNRMAREIHDGLGHCLTVVHVQLAAAASTIDADPAAARDAVEAARDVAHQGLQEVRRSVSALRATPLQDRPLPEALARLADESRAAGLDAALDVLGEGRPTSPQAALTLYRAAQEGLTNCRKHARAAAARVALDYRRPGRVALTVSDDGAGAGELREGFGLLGLRERAQLLGGEVRVRTAPGEGFVLELEVPG